MNRYLLAIGVTAVAVYLVRFWFFGPTPVFPGRSRTNRALDAIEEERLRLEREHAEQLRRDLEYFDREFGYDDGSVRLV